MNRTPHKGMDTTPLEEQLRNVQRERDELAAEVRNLTRFTDSSSMWQQIGATSRELNRVEGENLRLEKEYAALQLEKELVFDRCEELRLQLPVLESASQQQQLLIGVLREELKKVNYALLEQKESIEHLQSELDGARRGQAQRASEAEAVRIELEAQLETARAAATQAVEAKAEVEENQSTELNARGEELLQEVHALQERLRESEAARRQLLNKVHDLKGNVRVMVRLRPLLPGDGEDTSCIRCHPDQRSLQIGGDGRGSGQVLSPPSIAMID